MIIYYCILSLMFMLGVMVTPGTNLKWYDIVAAPLCAPYMVGRYFATYLVKNQRWANGTPAPDEKPKETSK